MVESVTNERNILAMANNPFVVRFYYSFTSKENLYIVMEYVNGAFSYGVVPGRSPVHGLHSRRRTFGALDDPLFTVLQPSSYVRCSGRSPVHCAAAFFLTDFGLSCVGVIDRTDNLNEGSPIEAQPEITEAQPEPAPAGATSMTDEGYREVANWASSM
eukprot:gene1644-33036_t